LKLNFSIIVVFVTIELHQFCWIMDYNWTMKLIWIFFLNAVSLAVRLLNITLFIWTDQQCVRSVLVSIPFQLF